MSRRMREAADAVRHCRIDIEGVDCFFTARHRRAAMTSRR